MAETAIDFPFDTINELLGQVKLTSGHHSDGKEACAMDLIGMAIEGEWVDTPSCVHPHLARVVHRINDDKFTTAEDRRRIVLEAGPLLVGTVDVDALWAVVVGHRAGFTVGGLVGALRLDRSVDLRSADLSSADLSSADLSSANLRSANLSSANLRSANLRSADLSSADLSSANLSSVDLSSADLSSADLSSANLRSANLRSADLHSADLRYANLRYAGHNEHTVWPEGFDMTRLEG